MQCVSCKSDISVQRLNLLPETKFCVSCSKEESVGCVDIIYHKTGNTIQIMPKSRAEFINKSARRNGFKSSLSGSSGKSKIKSSKKDVEFNSMKRIHSDEDLEFVFKKIFKMIDLQYSRNKIDKIIKEDLDSRLISGLQFRKVDDILNVIYPFVPENKKLEEEIIEEVDLEILKAFRDWKNSKVYK